MDKLFCCKTQQQHDHEMFPHDVNVYNDEHRQ